MKKYTDKEIEQMQEMYRGGMSYGDIAEHFKVAKGSSVHYLLKKASYTPKNFGAEKEDITDTIALKKETLLDLIRLIFKH